MSFKNILHVLVSDGMDRDWPCLGSRGKGSLCPSGSEELIIWLFIEVWERLVDKTVNSLFTIMLEVYTCIDVEKEEYIFWFHSPVPDKIPSLWDDRKLGSSILLVVLWTLLK